MQLILVIIAIAELAGILFFLDRISRRLNHNRTTQIGIKFSSGDTTMADLSLLVGQTSIATITPLEADGVTVTPGAVVSAQSFVTPDPSITVTQNADGTATIAAISANATGASVTATATVTDPDGTVGTFTKVFTVSVGSVTPPTGRTTAIGVTFSTPV